MSQEVQDFFCRYNSKKIKTYRLNKSGFITVDFLFSIVVSTSLLVLVIQISVALAGLEVLQYMTFAAARSFGVAHLSIGSQVDAGRRKWNSFLTYSNSTGKNPLKRLTNSTWIGVSAPEFLGGDTGNNPYPQMMAGDVQYAAGARVTVTLPVLKSAVPFLGSLDVESPGARLFAPTIREVTMQECQKIIVERGQKILDKMPLGPPLSPDVRKFFALEDAGC